MRTKRLLIIAEASHSQPRIGALSYYLEKNGWEILIISHDEFHDEAKPEMQKFSSTQKKSKKIFKYKFEGGFQKNIKKFLPFISSSFISRISQFLKSIILFPDSYFWWIPIIYLKFIKLKEKNRIDLILSSSSPASTHIAARFISKKHKIPWVADLRDLWSDNHDYKYNKLRRKLDAYVEKKVLNDAGAIVTVTEEWSKLLSAKFINNVHTIENACLFPKRIYSNQGNREDIRLTSVGPIYEPTRNLPILIQAIKRWNLSHNKKVLFNIYGPTSEEMQTIISKSGLENIYIFLHGNVSRIESWAIQCESTALILFSWSANRVTTGHIPLRTYEFAATNLPVIWLNFNQTASPIEKIIKNIKSVKSEEEIVAVFKNLDKDFTLAQRNLSVNIEITYEHRAAQYSKLLETLINT